MGVSAWRIAQGKVFALRCGSPFRCNDVELGASIRAGIKPAPCQSLFHGVGAGFIPARYDRTRPLIQQHCRFDVRLKFCFLGLRKAAKSPSVELALWVFVSWCEEKDFGFKTSMSPETCLDAY